MSTISAGTAPGTALVTSGDTTGQLVLQTNGTTTAVTIGTNQVVSLAQPLPVASGGTGSTTGVNLASSVTGTLPVANGGTGATSLTANNVLLGNGTSAVQVVAPGASGNILTSNGTTWTSAALALPSTTKTWTSFTASGTYTVPAGVTSIRVYAFGAGGNAENEYDGAWWFLASGAGGGCAFGDLAVTPGTTVTVTISGGNATVSYAAVTRFTANKGANATTPYSNPNAAAGGTASIGTGVTNGGAFTGGNGVAGGYFGGSGGSSASPLGNGNNGRSGAAGGAGWGTANGGDPITSSGYYGPAPSGGAGGAANTAQYIPGAGRGGYLVYSDPLLASLTSPGVSGWVDNTNGGPFTYGSTGGPGAGGGGVSNNRGLTVSLTAGPGGFGGGGGGAYNAGPSSNILRTGAGGFGASAGSANNYVTSGSSPTVAASGFGAGASTGTVGTIGNNNAPVLGTAGAAIVLIYA